MINYKSWDDPASLLTEDGLNIKIKKKVFFMSWGILFLAGIFEIFWAIGLKYSDGFTKLIPSIFTLITMIISFYLLSLALKTLPIGTAYAVWVGIGTIGTVIAGIILFGESTSLIRVVSILFILIGIIGLKFTTN